MNAQRLELSLLGVGTVLHLEKDAWSTVKLIMQATNEYAPPHANANKGAVVVCNEYMVNPVNFSWKWGEDELPMVDQYTYLGVDMSKDCSWGSQTLQK